MIIASMRLIWIPVLTSSSTCCDIHPSWIAGTRWIAFLTLILILRTDRSLFSTLNPLSLWIFLPQPSGCPAIMEEMARDKGDWYKKTEQGWMQDHTWSNQISFPARQNAVIDEWQDLQMIFRVKWCNSNTAARSAHMPSGRRWLCVLHSLLNPFKSFKFSANSESQ